MCNLCLLWNPWFIIIWISSTSSFYMYICHKWLLEWLLVHCYWCLHGWIYHLHVLWHLSEMDALCDCLRWCSHSKQILSVSSRKNWLINTCYINNIKPNNWFPESSLIQCICYNINCMQTRPDRYVLCIPWCQTFSYLHQGTPDLSVHRCDLIFQVIS